MLSCEEKAIMFCIKCGVKLPEETKFCYKCGNKAELKDVVQVVDSNNGITEEPRNESTRVSAIVPMDAPLITESEATTLVKAKKMKGKTKAIVVLLVVIFAGVGIGATLWFLNEPLNDPIVEAESVYWLGEAPSAQTVAASLWSINEATVTGTGIGADDYILSVSPSGRYFLVVDANRTPNLQAGRPSNQFGIDIEHISLYTYRAGRLMQTHRININAATNQALNDTIVTTDDLNVTWSPDESRVLISPGVEMKRSFSNFQRINSDIYLINFAVGTIENLTGWYNEPETIFDGADLDFMPQWIDDTNIRFIRYRYEEHFNEDYDDYDSLWLILLKKMDLRTGNVELMTELSRDDRVPAVIYDYAVHGNYVYFSKFTLTGPLDSPFDVSGFFSTRIGTQQASPNLLVSLSDMQQNVNEGILGELIRVEISPDGRWALLTASYPRFWQLDIPTTYGPYAVSIDAAYSHVTRRPWIPMHGVVLFDLYEGRVANPFVSSDLYPTTVIVTAATFAPDGKSLIFAAFGSGGLWSPSRINETTLYQVRLDDGSFDAIRIFATELGDGPAFSISWLENNALWIGSTWYGNPRFSDTLPNVVIPASFEVFGDFAGEAQPFATQQQTPPTNVAEKNWTDLGIVQIPSTWDASIGPDGAWYINAEGINGTFHMTAFWLFDGDIDYFWVNSDASFGFGFDDGGSGHEFQFSDMNIWVNEDLVGLSLWHGGDQSIINLNWEVINDVIRSLTPSR